MSELEKQIVETWAIHNRVNLYLLDAIDPESLKLSLKEKKAHGRGAFRPHAQRSPDVAQARGA